MAIARVTSPLGANNTKGESPPCNLHDISLILGHLDSTKSSQTFRVALSIIPEEHTFFVDHHIAVEGRKFGNSNKDSQRAVLCSLEQK